MCWLTLYVQWAYRRFFQWGDKSHLACKYLWQFKLSQLSGFVFPWYTLNFSCAGCFFWSMTAVQPFKRIVLAVHCARWFWSKKVVNIYNWKLSRLKRTLNVTLNWVVYMYCCVNFSCDKPDRSTRGNLIFEALAEWIYSSSSKIKCNVDTWTGRGVCTTSCLRSLFKIAVVLISYGCVRVSVCVCPAWP